MFHCGIRLEEQALSEGGILTEISQPLSNLWLMYCDLSCVLFLFG